MKKDKQHKSYPGRHWFVFGVLLLALCLLGARGVYLQHIETDYLQAQGDARYLRTLDIVPSRGLILDRNGEALAVSTPVDSAWALPKRLCESRQGQANKDWKKLTDILSIKAEKISKACKRYANKEFMFLKRHLTPESAAEVMAQNIPGVSLKREYKRYYPSGAIAGHLLGFTNVDNQGQEGLELAYNNYLSGSSGKKRVLRDRVGNTVETVDSVRRVEDGRDLTLSIDSRLQYLVFRHLKAAVTEHRALGGAAVILDPRSGEVLAMANEPSFNPNNRADFQSEKFRNRAVTDVLEPGSTVKPFTIAMALDSGQYRPDTTVQTAPGWITVGRHTIKDIHNYDLLTVSQVLAKSSNVGTTKIAMSLPVSELFSLFQAAGFGQSTQVGLPGEVAGALVNRGRWRPIEHATLAFGYGMNSTPLQLARAYTVFANDGKLMPLTLLKRQQPVDGDVILQPRLAQAVGDMMEMAASPNGTARNARVAQYRVAGKTGTVHKSTAGGYSEDRYQSVFVGYAPASSPRFVMVVVVDEPSAGKHFGGQVAAPVFSKVMSDALRLYNVTPDAEQDITDSEKFAVLKRNN